MATPVQYTVSDYKSFKKQHLKKHIESAHANKKDTDSKENHDSQKPKTFLNRHLEQKYYQNEHVMLFTWKSSLRAFSSNQDHFNDLYVQFFLNFYPLAFYIVKLFLLRPLYPKDSLRVYDISALL